MAERERTLKRREPRTPTSSSSLPMPLVLTALLLTGAIALAEDEAPAYTEADFLTRIRRLTYEGPRAGEGYFSPDGTKVVFQSEREEGNPFYQIYLLDLETGDTTRVSPGVGKTTCAFIQPGTGKVLYGSTHHDPRSPDLQRDELEFRASGKERRYAWDYDPEMDIWVADPETGEQSRLTAARGYDAEGSYSPDGRHVVFTSTRSAYEGELERGRRETPRARPVLLR